MEYKHYAEEIENTKRRSIAGYILGLIGSALSLVVCFVSSFLIFLISNAINKGLDLVIMVPEIQRSEFLVEALEKSGGLIKDFTGVMSIYWIIIFIGFVLGITGTVLCWKRNTVVSSSIMIIGGVFSIACVLFPGIFLMIGGIINLRSVTNRYGG